jgi:predicted dehydrogenase
LNDSDILNVLIIGCGNIAGDLDSNKLDSEQAPLTHAGAYTANQHFCIKGCVDISEDKSERFARRWGIPNAYTSIDQAIQAAIGYDVISICSPTGSHYEDLMACLLLSPKLVFCEKPVTSAVEDTLKIKTVYEQAGV